MVTTNNGKRLIVTGWRQIVTRKDLSRACFFVTLWRFNDPVVIPFQCSKRMHRQPEPLTCTPFHHIKSKA